MNQLFYNIAGGIVHQIQHKKQTTILEVIVRGKRKLILSKVGIGFISMFLLEARVLYLTNLKQKNLISVPLKAETDQLVINFVWFYQSVFLSKFVAFHPRTRIVVALMPSLLFRYFSLFLLHVRTLAQEKSLENCLRFGTAPR